MGYSRRWMSDMSSIVELFMGLGRLFNSVWDAIGSQSVRSSNGVARVFKVRVRNGSISISQILAGLELRNGILPFLVLVWEGVLYKLNASLAYIMFRFSLACVQSWCLARRKAYLVLLFIQLILLLKLNLRGYELFGLGGQKYP